jgi:WD40 repeat protein
MSPESSVIWLCFSRWWGKMDVPTRQATVEVIRQAPSTPSLVERTAMRPIRPQFTMRWLLLGVALAAAGIYFLSPARRPRPAYLASPYGFLHAMALAHDETWVATGGLESVSSHQTIGVVSLLDLATGQPRWIYKGGRAERFETLRVSANNRVLICQSHHALRFLDVASGKLLRAVAAPPDASGDGTMSPDASVAAWACDTGIRLQNVASGMVTVTLDAAPCSVLEFSPDGKLLASARGWIGNDSNPDDVTLWDLGAGRPRATLKGQGGGISRLAFSPDGRWLAAGRREAGVILVWDIASGGLIATLQPPPHFTSTRALLFSPDGKTLASVECASSGHDHLAFWDLSTQTARGRSPTGKQLVDWSLVFNRDGTVLLAGCEDGTIIFRDAVP